MTLEKTTGGYTWDFAVYRDQDGSGKTYAYVTRGAALIVYEVTDPSQPREVNRIYPAPELIRQIALSGRILAAAVGEHGVFLYALDDPEQPFLVHHMTGYWTEKVEINGYALFIDNFFPGLFPKSNRHSADLYSIHDLRQPEYLTGFATYTIFPSGIPRVYASVEPIVPGSSEIYYWEFLSTYSSLRRLRLTYSEEKQKTEWVEHLISGDGWGGRAAMLDSLSGLFAIRQYGFLTYANKFSVFDLSEGSPPKEIWSLPLEGIQGPALWDGNFAFLPQNDRWLQFDVTNPTEPQLLATRVCAIQPRRIVNGTGYALGGYDQGAIIAPLTESDPPEYRLPSTEIPNVDFIASAGGILAAAHTSYIIPQECTYTIQIYQMNERMELKPLSSLQTREGGTGLMISGGALIAAASSGFHIVDIHDPARPVYRSTIPRTLPFYYEAFPEVRRMTTWHGNYFYLYQERFIDEKHPIQYLWQIYSLEDLDHPVEVKTIELPEPLREKTIHRGVLYYARGLAENRDVVIGALDLRDPENPVPLQLETEPPSLPVQYAAFSIDGDRLYVCAREKVDNSITMYRVTDPLHPARVYTFHLSQDGNSPALAVDYFFVRNHDLIALESRDCGLGYNRSGLQKLLWFDISNPEDPVEKERMPIWAAFPFSEWVEWKQHLLIPAQAAGMYQIRIPFENPSQIEPWAAYR